MNSLSRLSTRIFNTPLLMSQPELDSVLSVIGPRVLAGHPVSAQDVPAREPSMLRDASARRLPGGGYMTNYGIAVLPIIGRVVRRSSWLDAMCDLTSYQTITDAATSILMDGQVRGLMLELDTPGGEANGVFDCAKLIRSMAEAVGKPVWAHANEEANSAGYVLACAAEEIWLATTAEVGSIGVVCAHIDMSGADEKAGMRWTYIFAGDSKVDGHPHAPLSDSARSDLTADVNDLYSMFISHVEASRGLSDAEIRATKAGVYRGSKALEVGLADHIGTLDEALSAFATRLDGEKPRSGGRAAAVKFRSQAMSGSNAETAAPQTAAPVEAAPAATVTAPAPAAAAPVAPAAPVQAAAPDAGAAETARCAELAAISAQASSLGVSFDLGKAIRDKVSASAARETVLEAAASRDRASEATTGYVPAASRGSSGAGPAAKSSESVRNAWRKSLNTK